VYLLRRRFHTYVAALQHMLETGQGAVLDRSIFSDWVFAEKNRLDGNIDSEGFFYYSQLRDQMLEQMPFPHVTVYLDVPAQQCHERIHGMRKRAAEVREEDRSVSLVQTPDEFCFCRWTELEFLWSILRDWSAAMSSFWST
jgi:deoxyadenosine/deoxycytidine kinase